MKDDYKNKLASKIASRYQDLEERIMQDIVRRIVKAGEITSTADWQINCHDFGIFLRGYRERNQKGAQCFLSRNVRVVRQGDQLGICPE